MTNLHPRPFLELPLAFFTVPILRVLYTLGIGIIAIGAIAFCEFHGPPKSSVAVQNSVEINQVGHTDIGMPTDDEPALSTTIAPKSAAEIKKPLASRPAPKTREEQLEAALSRREERLATWIVDNEAEWDSLDTEAQDCTTEYFIRGFSWTPEAALSSCLSLLELIEYDE